MLFRGQSDTSTDRCALLLESLGFLFRENHASAAVSVSLFILTASLQEMRHQIRFLNWNKFGGKRRGV